MRFCVLGPLIVLDADDRPVDIGQPMQRALLTMLILQAGRVVSTDAIVEGLWADAAPATAANSIQVYVSRLRKALGPSVAIATVGAGYCLDVTPESVDVSVFERLVGDGRTALDRGEFAIAEDFLRRALELDRGHPFAELSDRPFAIGASRRLTRLVATAEEDLVDCELGLGHHDALLAEVERLVAVDPHSERRWAQLMTALYLAGRQADALDAYQRARRVLVDELGVEPGPELRRIEADVLNQTLVAAGPLPRGAVTFLLTDVEGSVRRWETAPDAMSAMIARHDEVVRDIVKANGGVLRKTRGEGDSTFSIFVSPAEAVRAVLALQRVLQSELWPEPLALRVRAALHTGEAELRDADYYGPAVNRAARIRAVASGGQVLISDATATLIRDALPDGSGLRDLGEHRLRDLARPERLFQLTHPDLADDFAPISPSIGTRVLPSRSSSFIGRRREIDEVTALFANTRLVTLTGAGGCGKTSLAVEVAATTASRYADGVVFVDLGAVGADALVPEAFANALGVRARPGRTLLSSVAEYLGQQSCLAVVDNCEHVTGSVRAIIDEVLRAGPKVRVLATSREHLGLAGEVTWMVPPLEAEFAVDLFSERARAASSAFDADGQQSAIEDLCARLDGMPLAIELAAARVNVLSVVQINERLSDALRLLGDVGDAAPTRQRTLRATCEWSFALLSDAERELFACLAVFAGGFTLQAVEAIAALTEIGAEDVVGYFVRLVDKSLVLRSDVSDPTEPRYRMLEPLRQFALEQLTAKHAVATARDRHLEFFTAFAEEVEPNLERGGARQWSDRLLNESANLDAALEWAFTGGRDPGRGARIVTALAWGWFAAGRIAEGSQWSSAALAACQAPSEARAGALYAAMLMASARSDLETMQVHVGELSALADELESERFAAIALDFLGIVRWAEGVADEAADLHRKAAVLYDNCNDVFFGTLNCTEFGRALSDAGQDDEARSVLTEALRRARAIGEDAALGFALDAMATFALKEGETDHAASLIGDAVDHYRASAYQEGVASGLNSRAAIALAMGDAESAATDFEEAVELCRRLGHLGGAATSLEGLAYVGEQRGDVVAAIEYCAAADGLRGHAGLVLSGSELTSRTNLIARLRARMEPPAFADAWTRGESARLDDIQGLVTGRLFAVTDAAEF